MEKKTGLRHTRASEREKEAMEAQVGDDNENRGSDERHVHDMVTNSEWILHAWHKKHFHSWPARSNFDFIDWSEKLHKIQQFVRIQMRKINDKKGHINIIELDVISFTVCTSIFHHVVWEYTMDNWAHTNLTNLECFEKPLWVGHSNLEEPMIIGTCLEEMHVSALGRSPIAVVRANQVTQSNHEGRYPKWANSSLIYLAY
jgi:hypothetical protein